MPLRRFPHPRTSRRTDQAGAAQTARVGSGYLPGLFYHDLYARGVSSPMRWRTGGEEGAPDRINRLEWNCVRNGVLSSSTTTGEGITLPDLRARLTVPAAAPSDIPDCRLRPDWRGYQGAAGSEQKIAEEEHRDEDRCHRLEERGNHCRCRWACCAARRTAGRRRTPA